METITKKRTSRVLILALSALAMLLTGVVVASSANAAKATNTCPSGFTLTKDGASCYQASQTEMVTSQPTCKEGSLTASKTHCWVPALSTTNTITETADVIVSTSRVCPVGSERIAGQGDSLQCAKPGTGQEFTDPVPIISYSCPPGAVASGAGSSLRCQIPTAGAPPTPAFSTTTYSCPAGTITEGGSGADLICSKSFSEKQPVDPVTTTTYACPLGSEESPASGATPICVATRSETVTVDAETTTVWSCPSGSTATGGSGPSLNCARTGSETVTGPAPTCAANQTTLASGNCKARSGSFTTVPVGSACPAGAEQDGSTHEDGSVKCFPAVPPTICTAGFAYQPGSQSCTKTQAVTIPVDAESTTNYSCPAGSVGISGAAQTLVCAKSVTVTETVPPISTTTYRCPPGSAVAGGSGANLQCERTIGAKVFQSPISTTTYTCPIGTTPHSGTGPTLLCAYPTQLADVDPIETVTYGCPKDYIVKGAGPTLVCFRNVVTQVSVVPLVATTRSCPKTFNTIGSGAKMTCTRTITSAPIVSCANGTAPSLATIWGKPVSVCIVGAAHVSVSAHQICSRGTLSADKKLCFISATGPVTNPSVRPQFAG